MIKNFAITCLLFIAVNYSAQTAKLTMPEAFYNCWLASYEEDDQTTQIKMFRPCDFKTFKPAMYRQNITFEKDGKCKFLQLSPTDAHYFVVGKWEYAKKKKLVSVLDDKGVLMFKFKVKHLEKTLMKLEFDQSK